MKLIIYLCNFSFSYRQSLNSFFNLWMVHTMRSNIKPGIHVNITLKKDQRTGKLTEGIVKDILTNAQFHPHGIKVRLEDGQVGRVQEIIT